MTDATILQDIRRDEEIAELRAEVARLRDIAFGADEIVMGRLVNRLQLSPAEGWILTMLYQQRGDVLSWKRLVEGMPGLPDTERDQNCCAVIICRLRKKITNRDYIISVRGIGYCVSPEGINWLNSTTC